MFIPTLTDIGTVSPSSTDLSSAQDTSGSRTLSVADNISGIFLMFGLLVFYALAMWDRWKQLKTSRNPLHAPGPEMRTIKPMTFSPRIVRPPKSYGTVKSKSPLSRSSTSKTIKITAPTNPLPSERTLPNCNSSLPSQSLVPPKVPDSQLLQVPSFGTSVRP
ncbi:hypothetical protein DFP72DRAFT_304272 [Ephemerocybe angulata]|uniref:Uncharacterized protein n=1 Tax=Ephemerocybe angulata TaxID=980116 RepID=A0A8H6M9B5_9AGAR|nr:hypothetical protein DFP72DRAFT_304272 [Tulosesus angulatus]